MADHSYRCYCLPSRHQAEQFASAISHQFTEMGVGVEIAGLRVIVRFDDRTTASETEVLQYLLASGFGEKPCDESVVLSN